MNLEIIKVGNGDSKYPGNFTKKEIQIINKNLKGSILHLFSGKSDIGDVRVDYKFGTVKMDVFGYLEGVKEQFNTVLLDPPYNQKFADKYQKEGITPKQFIVFANTKDTTRLWDLIINKINPDRIILKSWNYYVPKGYKLTKGYICYPGGYRKSTILLILDKEFKELVI